MSQPRARGDNDSMPGSRRLYQDREQGVLLGVCAGLADFLGLDLTMTRVVAAVGALLFFPTVVLAYLLLALLLPKRSAGPEDEIDHVSRSLRRRVRSSPHSALDDIRYRSRELDLRLQRLEKYLISARFKLDREFETLKD